MVALFPLGSRSMNDGVPVAADSPPDSNVSALKGYCYPRMNLLLDNMIIKAAEKVAVSQRPHQGGDAANVNSGRTCPSTPHHSNI